MVLEGAKIYTDGIAINDRIKSKIREIIRAIKALSPISDVSMKLIKSGHIYESLVWGSVNGNPIGLYNRGASEALVLEKTFRRAKKECLRFVRERTTELPLAV